MKENVSGCFFEHSVFAIIKPHSLQLARTNILASYFSHNFIVIVIDADFFSYSFSY